MIGEGTLLSIGKYVVAAIRNYFAIPEIFVHVEINGPHFPHRTDIQSIVFSLTSRSGIAKVKEGRVRFYDPDDPTKQEEKHTGEIKF